MSISMRHLSLIALIAFGLTLGACAADPAADAPAATVNETPVAEPEVVVTGTSYSFNEASTIGFVGSKVTGSHEGGFKSFEGSMEVSGDDLASITVRVEIQTDSLWADNDNLTGHLKSAEFFGVEEHPTASFESTSVATNEDGTFTVTGNLDLHGVTKSISFPATLAKTEAGTFTTKAEFSIKRLDFGIVYPGKAEDLIRDDVLIKLDLETAA